MKLFNNKKIIMLLSLILVFTFFLNFGAKVYADFVLVPIGIKVLATILASMGILTFVNSNVGVDNFFDGLVEYGEQVKGMTSVAGMFVNLGLQSIKTNTKMRVDSLVSLIKEYYLSLLETVDPTLPTLDQPINTFLISESFKWSSVSSSLVRYPANGYYYHILDKMDLGDGYKLLIGTSQGYRSGYSYLQDISAFVEYNGTILTNVFYQNWYYNIVSNMHSVDDLIIDVVVSITDTEIMISSQYKNLTKNHINTKSDIYPVTSLVGLVGSLEAVEQDFPIPLSVPLGLAMPWQEALVNQTEIIGSTLDQLIELVSSISLEGYIEKLLDLPKSILDSLPQAQVITEEGIIVDVEEVVIPDILPDIKEQTGLLGAIVLGIEGIKDIIQDLVKPSEVEGLDFSPLQNIAVTDRFPFSLPWDLKNSISLLVAPPKAPVFNVPMVTEEIVIDLNEFETLAKISRSMLSIIFVVGLIITTRRFIGGA